MTFITEAGAERPDVKDRPPYRLERGAVALEHRGFAADDDGDFARGRLVDAARHRRLEGEHALFRRDRREALDRIRIVGAHLDPGRAGRETGEHALGAGQHPLGDGRGGQAGEDRVDRLGERARGIRPGRAGGEQRLGRLRVDVVHPEAEAAAPEAGGERPAETAQSDEAVSHRRSRLPNLCRGE